MCAKADSKYKNQGYETSLICHPDIEKRNNVYDTNIAFQYNPLQLIDEDKNFIGQYFREAWLRARFTHVYAIL